MATKQPDYKRHLYDLSKSIVTLEKRIEEIMMCGDGDNQLKQIAIKSAMDALAVKNEHMLRHVLGCSPSRIQAMYHIAEARKC